MGLPEDTESRSWEAKTFQASMLRAFAFLVPIFVSILTGVAVGAALPPPETRTGTVVWWVSVFVASTSGLIAADRLTRRLLPLATLLRLSMVFPDRAPSRVKLARRVTGSRAIAHELEKAGKAGLEGDRQQAAETILALVGALGDYDSRTRGHSERTQLFVTMLADELKLKPEDKGKLMWAALVHDIGKLKVPHEVLNKPGKPDEHEWHVLKSHPHQGALICEPLKQWMGEWWLAIEQHHEKYDGSGYPRGLAGAQISYGARIVTVADSYEVMTASRPYKRPMTAAAAREELTRCSGAHFDPTVVRAFLNISLGRMHRSAGPIAWIAQLLAVRPGPILGQILGGAAAAAGAAATALGLQLAPSWSSPPPPQVPVTAPEVVESPEPDEQPKPDAKPTSKPPRTPQAPPVFIPPEPIVPIGVLPPPATEPEPLGPPTPEPGEPGPKPPVPGPEPPAPEPEPEPTPPAPVPPSARNDSLAVDEDASGSVNVLANDDPGDAESLSLAGAGGARHGSVSTSPSGSVTYTPALNYHGLDSVSYQARTPDGTVLTGSVAITVSPVNDAPVAVADSVAVDEDSSGTAVGVLANDVDVDGDLLKVTGVGSASHGSATLASGVVRYTPTANYSGPDSFSYTIADPDGLTSTATVNVTVAPINHPPVAGDATLSFDEDPAAPQDLTAAIRARVSDPDGDTVTVTSVTGATNGSIAQPSPGTWSYAPNPNVHGDETLTYTVSDGRGGTASAVLLVKVNPVNDKPDAVDDYFEVAQDSSNNALALLANDSDVDGDSLSVTAPDTVAPQHGLLELVNESWIYTPTAGYWGPDSFNYEVDDRNGGTDVATVSIVVNQVVAASQPIAVDDTGSTTEDTPLPLTTLLLDNDDDPVNKSLLTVTSVRVTSAIPRGFVTQVTPGQWTYTPDLDWHGTETLRYTISNGSLTASATVTLTITPVNDAPSAAPDAYVSSTPLVIKTAANGMLANDSDVDGDPIRVVRLGAGASLLSAWAPDGSFTTIALSAGTHVFEYWVADNGNVETKGTVTITVSASTSGSKLYLQPGSTNALGSMTTALPSPVWGGAEPDDYDNDLKPGLTIKSGGDKLTETDPAKFQTWDFAADGLKLNGPVTMSLWTSLDRKTTQDLDYSSWILDCPDRTALDEDCLPLASTDKIHVDNWNVGAGWEEETVTIGSVSHTFIPGRWLRLRVGFNHADVWLAMYNDGATAKGRSSLNLTLG